MDILLIYSQTKEELTTNITEVMPMIGLIGYYRKFVPTFSNIIRPFNEWTKKNVSFKWTKQCQKNLDYVKQVITTSPILAYLDPGKEGYLFTDSSKHSLSWILVHYTKQLKENSTKINIPHQITFQSSTFQGPRKIGAH